MDRFRGRETRREKSGDIDGKTEILRGSQRGCGEDRDGEMDRVRD